MHAFLRSTTTFIVRSNVFNDSCCCRRWTMNRHLKLSRVAFSSSSVSPLSHTRGIITNVSTLHQHANNYARRQYINTEARHLPSVILVRNFSLNSTLYDIGSSKPSSKVEVTVQALLNEKKTKESSPVTSTEKTVVKKSIKQRVIDEVMHYYHGFRLLFIDINVSLKLVWRVLNGKTLTRREHRLLVRTTSDFFRLLPFSVFIIVPFMEFLLPVAIKLFPGMLPSTFQTVTEKEDKIQQNLKVKLEMAKFLTQTLDEMAVQHKDHKSELAKEFTEWFTKVRTSGEQVSNEDIMKFSQLFEDEITLDSLHRPQLLALCRVLEVNTIGTTNFLRFQLRMKLRSLAADDRVIQREGVDSMNLSEVQQACRARGMRAYGMSEERLRSQLQDWIHLSLNEKVPPSLLLLSRALMLPENVPTSDKLKVTIKLLPENIVTSTKAAIGEREGKIENKTKIEMIKEEERKIKEERAEEQEEAIRKEKETLVDKAPIISASDSGVFTHSTTGQLLETSTVKADQEFSAKDLEVVENALDSLTKTKKTLLVEREAIKDIKEEIADYQEDVQELKDVMTTSEKPQELRETKAAQRLLKKVNNMISKMDTAMEELENKRDILKLKNVLQSDVLDTEAAKTDDLITIDELMMAIKKIQSVPDESRLQLMKSILSKIDGDSDGHVKVEDVLRVIDLIGEDVQGNMNTKQLDELVKLLNKEELLDIEVRKEKMTVKENLKKLKEASEGSGSIDVSNSEPRLPAVPPTIQDITKTKSSESKNL